MRWVKRRVVGPKSPAPSCGALFLAVLILLPSAVIVQGQEGENDVNAIVREVGDLKAELERAKRRISELEDVNRLFKPEPSSGDVVNQRFRLGIRGERAGDAPSASPASSNIVEQSPPPKHLTESAPKPQPLSPAQQEQLARADELLRRGDVAGARLLLEHLLSTGSPAVAFKLAETYDPKRLSAWRVFGIRADPRRADELYQRAQAGGVKDAEATRWPSPDRTGATSPALHLR
jgi:hypothetical protein